MKGVSRVSFVRNLVRRIIYKENATSDLLVSYLKKHGAEIGSDVIFFAPNKTFIDKQNPYLLKIGNHVRITEGVKILTHDYSWSVLKLYSSDTINEGAILGSQSAVEIGNNVFIGMNAIITCGVTIGNNVIIGAGSVVTKNCEPDGVYAGVPAKRIMSIEEFYKKRSSLQFEEARSLALHYRAAFGTEPNKSIFKEYFMLFCSNEEAAKVDIFKKQMETSENYDACMEYMKNNKPMFESFESFLNACYDRN